MLIWNEWVFSSLLNHDKTGFEPRWRTEAREMSSYSSWSGFDAAVERKKIQISNQIKLVIEKTLDKALLI